LRQRHELTVADLAKKAGVSTHSIIILEDKDRYRKLVEDAANTTGRSKQKIILAWARILAKIALTFNDDPDPWLASLSTYGIPPFRDDEKFKILSSARKRLAREGEDTMTQLKEFLRQEKEKEQVDTLAQLRTHLNANAHEPYTLPVFVLTASSRSSAAQRTFYEDFFRLVCGTISPRLELSFDKAQLVPSQPHQTFGEVQLQPKPGRFQPSFGEIMAGLSSLPNRHRVVLGPFQMVGRFTYDVAFIPIPGWRIRLSCLAAPSNKITWQSIREKSNKRNINVITIAGEAGDVYMRGFCGYPQTHLSTQENYDVYQAAEQFQRFIDHDPVIVVGEYEATAIKYILRKDYRLHVEDRAADPKAFAPRFQLAMATNARDVGWTEALRAAVREVFASAPDLMAQIYGKYMIGILGEELQHITEILMAHEKEQIPPRTLLLERILEPQSIPSYLQLNEIDFPISSVFGSSLRHFLKEEIEKRKWLGPPSPLPLSPRGRGDGGEGASIEKWLNQLLPFLVTEGQQSFQREVLQQLADIRRALESMGTGVGTRE
jgi:DNA-binding XRE family transcriptional regulator